MTDQTGTLVCSSKEKSINRSFLCTQNPSGNSTGIFLVNLPSRRTGKHTTEKHAPPKDVEASETNDDTAREMSV
jgi:hypothetical protein